MKNSILVALTATIASLNLIAAEPSAFGAGNLDNPTPYGLTSSERTEHETNNNLQKSVVTNSNQGNEVDSLRERIDGLQSIIESLSKKAQSNKTEISTLLQQNGAESKNTDAFYSRLSEVNKANTEDIIKIKVAISELSKAMELMNKSQVSKDEFTNLVNEVNKLKGTPSSEPKNKANTTKASDNEKSETTNTTDLSKMSNIDVDSKAKEFYDKKNYTKAMEYYEYLIEKNYKPAVAHFMIGEINYNRKKYSDAIAYFKKSTSLYAKASYMPTLLLHTATSMDKTADKKNAKMFYEGLVSKYPESKEAQEAKKYLSSMK